MTIGFALLGYWHLTVRKVQLGGLDLGVSETVSLSVLVPAVAILVAAGGFVGCGADDRPEVDDPAK